MWATSRSEQPAMAGLLQLGSSPVQPVQGTDHLSQSGRADTSIQHCGFDTFMPKQLLDVGHLRTLLQKVRREAVAQSVGGNACAQAGLRAEPAHHPLHVPLRERLLRTLAVKQIADGTVTPEIAT